MKRFERKNKMCNIKEFLENKIWYEVSDTRAKFSI